MSSSSETTTASHVLLWIPNLIGYVRVLCTLTSFIVMMVLPERWVLAISLYVASFVGDLFDGMAARYFHQSSTYGGLLDMVTDRCSTLGLLYILGGDYAFKDAEWGVPFCRLMFLGLIILDISSHWCQMHSTMSLQSTHHKSEESNKGRNILVQWYYQHYWFFGYLCVGAEFTYICLYLCLHTDSVTWLLYAFLPGCVLKQIINVCQLASACYAVAAYDAAKHQKQKA